MPILHAFHSNIADGADDTLLQPSDWNAAHVVTCTPTPSSTNISVTDTHELLLLTGGASGITATLPSAAGRSGTVFRFVRVDSNTGEVTIATISSQKINDYDSYALVDKWQRLTVVSDGSKWVILEESA